MPMNELQEAIAKRDKYLEDHPHLKEKQQEIDVILDKCTDGDRYEVIMTLLLEQMERQAAAINLLKEGLTNESTQV